MGKTRRREKGVTLIELMIVLVIAAILVGGVYTLFATQQRSYTVQDQVTGVQQDARAALTIMARDIRMAGSLTGRDGFTVNTFTDAITPTNGGSGGTDSITVVLAAEEFTSGANSVTVCNVNTSEVTLGVRDPSTGACTSVPIGSFFDPDPEGRYVAFEGEQQVYVISGIDNDKLTLTQSPPAYLENVGARVFLVKAIKYSIVGSELKRDDHIAGAQPLAGDGVTTVVEDLQFAYQVAGSDDWIFDQDTATWPAGESKADIRMVRINITVRTQVGDAVVEDADAAAQFNQPQLEDHTDNLNGPDGFRRRVYTTVVKARNL